LFDVVLKMYLLAWLGPRPLATPVLLLRVTGWRERLHCARVLLSTRVQRFTSRGHLPCRCMNWLS